MFKKDITYKNFDDVEVTETYHFHLTKAELIEEQIYGMGSDDTILKIIQSNDNRAIMEHFKAIIRKAIGRREGSRFVKHPAIAEEFFASEAYSEFLFDLMTRPEAAVEFIRGLMPEDLKDKVNEVALAQKAAEAGLPQLAKALEAQGVPVEATRFVVNASPEIVQEARELHSETMKGVQAKVEPIVDETTEPVFAEQPSETDGWIMKPIMELTDKDLREMPRDQFIAVFGQNPRAWARPVHVAAMMRGDIHGKR